MIDDSVLVRVGFLPTVQSTALRVTLNARHLVINFQNCRIDACQSLDFEPGGAFITAASPANDRHLRGSFCLVALRNLDHRHLRINLLYHPVSSARAGVFAGVFAERRSSVSLRLPSCRSPSKSFPYSHASDVVILSAAHGNERTVWA